MLKNFMTLARPALFALAPEKAHRLTIEILKQGFFPRQQGTDDERLNQTLWGLNFPNPLGMAAGFDKNAEVPDVLLQMGFGFCEIGTVTPKPQAGNPTPRVFRLIEDRAIINRLGFNNEGHKAVLARLLARPHHGINGIIGVNIGANKQTKDKTADYVAGLTAFYQVADYFTINISSPNTPGLRDLQSPQALENLLAQLMTTRATLAQQQPDQRTVPILIKLAPDIPANDLPEIIATLRQHHVDGIIVSNTTLSRDGLSEDHNARQTGGLSGRPLFLRSTAMLGEIYRLTEGQIPLIGVGGIDSAKAAIAKIEAGATLLQLYTGLIYEGPGLIDEIKRGLITMMQHNGLTSLSQATGRQAVTWAAKWSKMN